MAKKEKEVKMKAILEFNLPEDKKEFKDAQNGFTWKMLLYVVDNKLRNWIKHGHSFTSVDECLEEIRTLIIEGMNDDDLSFD